MGTGEGVDGLEAFDARRLAGRILGMGDVVLLAEKAQEGFDREEAVKLEKKLRNNDFTLEDFADQIRKIRKWFARDILAMLPRVCAPPADMEPAPWSVRGHDRVMTAQENAGRS